MKLMAIDIIGTINELIKRALKESFSCSVSSCSGCRLPSFSLSVPRFLSGKVLT